MRERIGERFAGALTRQDQQRLRPHVTVANKLPSERARAAFEALRAGFHGVDAQVSGLSLFRYLRGSKSGDVTFARRAR